MNQDARHRLEDVLDREIELTRALSAVLSAERSALIGAAPEAVHSNAAEKIRLLASLEKLETERRALASGSATPGSATPGSATPGSATPGSATPGSAATRWRELADLLAGCRQANEVNGHIIRVRQHQVRQLLDIVRGGPSITYDPHGKTRLKPLRALARA